MSGTSATGVHLFGIRHLSPAGAYHLRQFLDEIQPTIVLIEGPSDANQWIKQMTVAGVVPPIALMAYTETLPIRTLLYPLAAYSPEYEAIRWAAANQAEAAFIDLPSEIAISLYEFRKKARNNTEAIPSEDEITQEDGIQTTEEAESTSDQNRSRLDYYERQHQLYEDIAALAGEQDYESYWERHFEHVDSSSEYQQEITAYSRNMRELQESEEKAADPLEAAINEVRESYMRLEISRRLADGIDPGRIVVVTGAHHVSGLNAELDPMSELELAALPRTMTKQTLMPYSYYKLSNQSGYGAGNPAPAYYELLWDCLQEGGLQDLPSLYLTQVTHRLREQGTFRSTASVIEGVRLAYALASLRNSKHPILQDLRDAAVVSIGYGELGTVAEAMARTDIGTAIGYLPEGVSQTPIQDDLSRQLKKLKLTKYKSVVAEDLELDLRENRRVKSEEAAYLDLNRSILFHRLELLEIPFVKRKSNRTDSSSWAENWMLQWSPEAEIQLIEATLKGETIEWATAYAIREKLEQCSDVTDASKLIRISSNCGLPTCMEEARQTLQRLSVDGQQFEPLASAAFELSALIRYGSIRRMDTATLIPLLQQLFLRASLLLVEASACSDEAAPALVVAINSLHTVSQDHEELVDDELWLRKLWELASRDDRNPRLSGFAFAILLERHIVSEEECEQEVARRLSPGISADLGAGWFEGLAMRNRYALLSRPSLWHQLDRYIGSLDREQFQRSLVFLRRSFGAFEPREKASLAELLSDMWGSTNLDDAVALQQPLTEVEQAAISELDEFDFDDF
ncbi:MAG: DUF5682 family protein [Candidatus Pristimantibacillus sp.]